MVLWGRSVLGSQKVPLKVPPRFCQGSTKVAQVSWCLWSSGQVPLGLPKGSMEGSTKAAPRFRQGSTKVPARVHQGSSSFVVSLVLICLGCQKVLWKVPSSLL